MDPVTYAITWAQRLRVWRPDAVSTVFWRHCTRRANPRWDRWKCSVVASDGVDSTCGCAERAVFEVAEPDIAFAGVFEDSQAGYRVSSAGDINNDGYGDVARVRVKCCIPTPEPTSCWVDPPDWKAAVPANGRIVENGVYSGDVIEVSDVFGT